MSEPNRRLILAGLSGLALSNLMPTSARATGGLLDPDATRGDIRILYDAYTSLHPGLYRYITPSALLRERRRLDQFAARPRSLGEFFLALSAFTASIRCGHSFLNPANQTSTVTEALFGRPDRLPFAFEWLGRNMIVTADLGSGHRLAAGTRIVSIDGVPARDVLARMLPYARTDGSNEARRIADLGILGDEAQGDFDTFRSLLFPATGSSTRIGVRVGGGVSTMTCPLLAAADRNAALKPIATGSPYGWRFEVNGITGVLTMPTWAVFHGDWDWRGFIDAAIDTAIDRGLPGMVIDLRDNGGGLDCGAAIIARLIVAPLATDNYSRHVRYRAVPNRLLPHLTTWDPGFRDWGAFARGPDAGGFYTLERPGDATDADLIRPAKRRYAGRVVVLVGPRNASATFQFAALVKQHRLATLVGEPTGGNLRGINGGAFFFVHLPNSKLEIDLPLIAYRPTTPQPDAGVTPDFVVGRRPVNLVGDRQMERAMTIAAG